MACRCTASEDILCRYGTGERAAGLRVGNEHGLAGVERFGCLGHECPGEDDNMGFDRHRLAMSARLSPTISMGVLGGLNRANAC